MSDQQQTTSNIVFAPIESRSLMGGSQDVYRFDNGYGASVVRHLGSYGGDRGLFELGVIKWHGDTWNLTYDTPITDDVIGYLESSEVTRLLREIAVLPADRPAIEGGAS